MYNRIVIIGDSFTFGHGCDDKNYYWDPKTRKFVGEIDTTFENEPSKDCWASLLQQSLSNITVHNLARPGQSIMGMFRDLAIFNHENRLNSQDIVICGGTFPDRIEVAHHTNNLHPSSWCIGTHSYDKPSVEPKEYHDIKTNYIKYLYNSSIGINQYVAGLLGIYAVAQTAGADFYWSRPPKLEESPYEEVIESLLQNISDRFIPHVYRYDFSGVADYHFNLNCYQPDQHVNSKGHKLYYEKAIAPLMRKLGVLQ